MAFSGDVAALNEHMLANSYVKGYSFSAADEATFKALGGCPSASAHPHAARWYLHCASVLGLKVVASSGAAPAAAADDMGGDDLFADDDMGGDDLFGDDDAEAAPAMSLAEKAKAAKAAKEAKKKKDKVEKSQVVIEVKPWEADQDLPALYEKIKREVTMDGLQWGEAYKLQEVGYGIKKLVMSCVIEDDKVMTDDFLEPIQEMEDHVQSVEMCTMNRL